MPSRLLSAADVAHYHDKGYVVVQGLFDDEEISLPSRAAKEDHELDKRSFSRADGGAARCGCRSGPSGRQHLRHVRPLRADGALARNSSAASFTITRMIEGPRQRRRT